MSKIIIIKRAREARTFNRKGRFGVAKSSLAKNERKLIFNFELYKNIDGFFFQKNNHLYVKNVI